MCEIVNNCSKIDLSTCSPIYAPVPNTSALYLEDGRGLDTLYDEKGCFYTDILRETNSYNAYMKFSLWMGILTIGMRSHRFLRVDMYMDLKCFKLGIRNRCLSNETSKVFEELCIYI